MSKKRQSKVDPDLFDADQVDKKLQEGLSKPVYGRPPDPEKSKRVRFTTMIDPELKSILKKTAVDRDMTGADLLDLILREYFRQ